MDKYMFSPLSGALYNMYDHITKLYLKNIEGEDIRKLTASCDALWGDSRAALTNGLFSHLFVMMRTFEDDHDEQLWEI